MKSLSTPSISTKTPKNYKLQMRKFSEKVEIKNMKKKNHFYKRWFRRVRPNKYALDGLTQICWEYERRRLILCMNHMAHPVFYFAFSPHCECEARTRYCGFCNGNKSPQTKMEIGKFANDLCFHLALFYI